MTVSDMLAAAQSHEAHVNVATFDGRFFAGYVTAIAPGFAVLRSCAKVPQSVRLEDVCTVSVGSERVG